MTAPATAFAIEGRGRDLEKSDEKKGDLECEMIGKSGERKWIL